MAVNAKSVSLRLRASVCRRTRTQSGLDSRTETRSLAPRTAGKVTASPPSSASTSSRNARS